MRAGQQHSPRAVSGKCSSPPWWRIFSRALHFLRMLRASGLVGGEEGQRERGRGPTPAPTEGRSAESQSVQPTCSTLAATRLPDGELPGRCHQQCTVHQGPFLWKSAAGSLPGNVRARAPSLRHLCQESLPSQASLLWPTLCSQISIPLSTVDSTDPHPCLAPLTWPPPAAASPSLAQGTQTKVDFRPHRAAVILLTPRSPTASQTRGWMGDKS